MRQEQLRFYGAAQRRGPRSDPSPTGRRAPGAADDPFALDLADDDVLRELYLEAEGEDGYLRDRNVFSAGIRIEDDAGAAGRPTAPARS